MIEVLMKPGTQNVGDLPGKIPPAPPVSRICIRTDRWRGRMMHSTRGRGIVHRRIGRLIRYPRPVLVRRRGVSGIIHLLDTWSVCGRITLSIATGRIIVGWPVCCVRVGLLTTLRCNSRRSHVCRGIGAGWRRVL